MLARRHQAKLPGRKQSVNFPFDHSPDQHRCSTAGCWPDHRQEASERAAKVKQARGKSWPTVNGQGGVTLVCAQHAQLRTQAISNLAAEQIRAVILASSFEGWEDSELASRKQVCCRQRRYRTTALSIYKAPERVPSLPSSFEFQSFASRPN